MLLSNRQTRFIISTFVTVIFFSIIYWFYGDTDHFVIIPNDTLTFLDAFYFSLGSYTTIGYGDITAKSQFMRLIVSMQIILLVLHITSASL